MKTFFITGGAGFIGSNLTDRLLKLGHKVVTIDNFCDSYDPKLKEKNIENFKCNPNYKLYIGDIRDREKIRQVFECNNIDFVIHLAALAGVRTSIDNPQLYLDVNCIGTQNIFEEMKNHNLKKIIMASSSSVYGNCKDYPFTENMCVDYPISPYAASKKSNEIMGYVYHNLYDFNMVLLRFFTVYGPRQRPDLAINKFTNLIINNEPVTMYGDGTTLRDYTYIDDVIDGIIKSVNYIECNSNVYEIFNIGSSNPISLKDMINTIGEVLDVEPEVIQLPTQLGDVNMTYASIDKARRIIGYEPKVSFLDGVKRFVEWYKNN